MANIHECEYCEGGIVELKIQGEIVDTITCPHCNGGIVSPTEAASQRDSINALNVAIADEQYKY